MNDATSGKWQVDERLDVLRPYKPRGRYDVFSGWRDFDTEEEAREFIVTRAHLNVLDAEAQLKAARRRLKKCQKKFAPVEPSVEPPK